MNTMLLIASLSLASPADTLFVDAAQPDGPQPLAVLLPTWGSRWEWHTSTPEARPRLMPLVVQGVPEDGTDWFLTAMIGGLVGWLAYDLCKDDEEECLTKSAAGDFAVGFAGGVLFFRSAVALKEAGG